MSRTLLLSFVFAAIPTLSAMADPATPAEAARLTTLFERYVGHAAPGQPGAVAVVPKGEAYVATLDLKRALAGLEGFGITVETAVSSTTLQPLPDGTWKVTSTDIPPITLHAGQQTLNLSSATSSFEGVYDPKLYGFSHSRQDQTGYDLRQATPTTVQNRRVDKVGLTLDGAAAAKGGVDVKGRYDLTGTSSDIEVRSAPVAPEPGSTSAAPPPSSAPTRFSYKVPTGTVTIGIDGLRTKDLLDLWAFLVAHPSRDSLAAAQGDLKALLRSGLPYLANLRESAAFQGPTLSTPIGVVSASSLGGSIDVADLATRGKAETSLSFADLKIPAGQLPPWFADLVPTALDLHLGLDGFNAGAAAAAAVDDLDLRKDVVLTPDQQAALGRVLWPGDGTVTLGPSRVTTAALDLRMEGQATLGAQLAGRLTITGKGLDKEIAALQERAATDPGAGQVLGPLTFAKNLAKPGPDGSLVWVVELARGAVTVNGAPLQ